VTEYDHLSEHMKLSRRLLELNVKAGQPFAPMLVPVRGDDPIGVIIPPRTDTDAGLAILKTGQLVVHLLSIDTIVLVSDTYEATIPNNPLTGKIWNAGEMEQVALHHNGIEKGWVTDCLTVIVFRRDGHQSSVMMPYSVKRRQVTWKETIQVDSREPGMQMEGRLSEMFSDVSTLPDLPFTMTDREAEVILTALGCVVLLGEHATKE